MPKPKLVQRKGNVYWTPTRTPASTRRPRNVDLITGEIVGKRMEHQSHDNVDGWTGIIYEVLDACVDSPRRRSERRQGIRR